MFLWFAGNMAICFIPKKTYGARILCVNQSGPARRRHLVFDAAS